MTINKNFESRPEGRKQSLKFEIDLKLLFMVIGAYYEYGFYKTVNRQNVVLAAIQKAAMLKKYCLATSKPTRKLT